MAHSIATRDKVMGALGLHTEDDSVLAQNNAFVRERLVEHLVAHEQLDESEATDRATARIKEWAKRTYWSGMGAKVLASAVAAVGAHQPRAPRLAAALGGPQFMRLLPGKGKPVILGTLEYARLQPLHEKWQQIDSEAIRPELKPVFLNERAPRQGVKAVSEKARGILAEPCRAAALPMVGGSSGPAARIAAALSGSSAGLG